MTLKRCGMCSWNKEYEPLWQQTSVLEKEIRKLEREIALLELSIDKKREIIVEKEEEKEKIVRVMDDIAYQFYKSNYEKATAEYMRLCAEEAKE